MFNKRSHNLIEKTLVTRSMVKIYKEFKCSSQVSHSHK